MLKNLQNLEMHCSLYAHEKIIFEKNGICYMDEENCLGKHSVYDTLEFLSSEVVVKILLGR